MNKLNIKINYNKKMNQTEKNKSMEIEIVNLKFQNLLFIQDVSQTSKVSNFEILKQNKINFLRVYIF